MKTMVTLTHEEAQSYLAYALICETIEGAFWNSGRRQEKGGKLTPPTIEIVGFPGLHFVSP